MKNLKRNISVSINDVHQLRIFGNQNRTVLKSSHKLLLCCIYFSITYAVNSQNNNDTLYNQKDKTSKEIRFSPKLGLTYANHKQKSEHTSGSKRKAIFGFMAGVGLVKPITENIAFESGIFLAQKGSKSDSDGFSDGDEYYEYSDILRMLYADIPLLIRYRLNEDGNTLAFYGGVQPSFLLNAKQTNKTANTEDKETVTDRFKKFDAAASIGVGYQFENGIGINANYEHGLVNINKSSEPNGNNYFKTYNRVFKISVAYRLGEKAKKKNN